MRAGYLALAWPEGADLAKRRAMELASLLEHSTAWQEAHAGPGLRIWTTRRDPPPIRVGPGDRRVIIGPTFKQRPAEAGEELADLGAVAAARRFTRARWGRYVAFFLDPRRDEFGVFRDPSGGMNAFNWSLGDGLAVITSQISGLPPGIGPRRPSINWDRIAAFAAKPAACATDVLVDGVVAVQPGECITLWGPRTPQVVWSPSAFAADPITDRQVAAAELRARVSTCTAALVGGHEKTILEVSGGLDSAVLAGTIHEAGMASRVAEGLNIAFGRPESDEQAYARAVTERAGLPLTERWHAPEALDFADLDELAGDFRPSANGVDPKWDRDEIARARETGAGAIISGQGGDAVFLQMATPAVAADLWQGKRRPSLCDPVVADLARRTRRSVWTLLRDARAELRGCSAAPEELWSSLISREVRAATRDLKPRWLREAEIRGVTPGKRLHIHALARFFLNEGPSRRRREVDIVYPLFAQPVLEHVLRIPAPVLAGASYDRAFAREVFADRLPESVLKRRAKGIVTVYFAKLIANSLADLRPFLLDGALAQAGVLDRAHLEQALTPEHLIWAAKPSDILWAVATEAWVRHWQGRTPDSRPGLRHH